MKKIFLLLAITVAIVSCKNAEDKKSDTENTATEAALNVQIYKGEFLYLADAAVLKGDNFIYGVTIDDTMQQLADQVKSIKKDDFDMVPVIVKGSLSKKAEGAEGWDEIITITEIINVSSTPSEADIKIEENKS